jgi:hypothetical protein
MIIQRRKSGAVRRYVHRVPPTDIVEDEFHEQSEYEESFLRDEDDREEELI